MFLLSQLLGQLSTTKTSFSVSPSITHVQFCLAMEPNLLKDLRTALAVLLAVQLGVIFFPYACCYAIHVLGAEFFQFLHNYFKPDYETALLEGYTRPIIGLVLCEKCTALRSWPKGSRMRHFDDLTELEASGTKGCWLCRSIRMGISQSEADRENPLALDRPEQVLPSHPLLSWFAERTETGDGFLDHLRGKSTARRLQQHLINANISHQAISHTFTDSMLVRSLRIPLRKLVSTW